jgi:hypothetical protein
MMRITIRCDLESSFKKIYSLVTSSSIEVKKIMVYFVFILSKSPVNEPICNHDGAESDFSVFARTRYGSGGRLQKYYRMAEKR